MKVLLKSIFLLTTLTILSYSAVAAGADELISGDSDSRQCCKYQVDCPEDQRCNTIYPECSADLPHICGKASAEFVGAASQ